MELKCKMCGGELQIIADSSVCVCEYCGSKQTIPHLDNDKKVKLFERANRIRLNCEFDKAASVYESIVAEYPDEAEGYWGLVLCKYGIEYVDDPKSGDKIPTCHRSSFLSVLEDADYKAAISHADDAAKEVYTAEAKSLEVLRGNIISVSSKEKPYDIFICYKETDANGDRTLDSVLAQDIYDRLTEKNYRVFFARITLEDRLGEEYEPYIFAAINSAKVMLVVGTDYNHYNAVWVRNEWSRFLQIVANDSSKYLIPCFKNIDAYDMPNEFAKLQSQDMGKIGAMQDLLRGIDKIFGRTAKRAMAQGVPAMDNSPEAILKAEAVRKIKAGETYLSLGNYERAEEAFEQVTKDFPDEYAGWWGMILASTKNFTVTTKDLFEESLKNFKYVTMTAPESEIESLKDQFETYLKAMVLTFGEEEVNDVKGFRNQSQSRLDSFNNNYQSQVNAVNHANRLKQTELEKMTDNYIRSKSYAEACEKTWKKGHKKRKSRLIVVLVCIVAFLIGGYLSLKLYKSEIDIILGIVFIYSSYVIIPYELYKWFRERKIVKRNKEIYLSAQKDAEAAKARFDKEKEAFEAKKKTNIPTPPSGAAIDSNKQTIKNCDDYLANGRRKLGLAIYAKYCQNLGIEVKDNDAKEMFEVRKAFREANRGLITYNKERWMASKNK